MKLTIRWKSLLPWIFGIQVLILTASLMAQTAVGNFVRLVINGNTWSTSAGTATITVPNSTDTLVGRATTDTLTNKTLTAPVISTISNTGTVTLFTSTDTVVGKATTDTLTNKTLDADAGTGNVLTVSEKLWIAAGRCDNATPTSPLWSFPTTNPGVPTCQTGTNTQFATLDFADGANTLSAQTHLMLPTDFTSTIDVRIKWFTTATTNSVVWNVATICVADAETSDPAFNTASTVTDAAKGTTNQQNDATITTLTITGCAAGELMYLRIFRDPTLGADTLAATARLVGIELTYRRAI